MAITNHRVETGDRVQDNDPRFPGRRGRVVNVRTAGPTTDHGSAQVMWNTGKETTVDLARFTWKAGARTGYSVIPDEV